MPRWQRVVQRSNKKKKKFKKKKERERSQRRKNMFGGSPFPQHDKGVVASRSLQSKGRGNGHCSTHGSQLLSEMATNRVGGRWQHVRGNEASLQHTCIIERQIKGPSLPFSHTKVPFVAPVVQHR